MHKIPFVCLLFLTLYSWARSSPEISAWTPAQAQAWNRTTGWLVGCNFGPSSAINQLEMFQADTFDPTTIDRELGWAESLGFNSVRVFLHHQLWSQDAPGFLARLEQFLALADRHHIGVMFVLFDSCWDPFPQPGRQHAPVPHRHNSGWVQSPGAEILRDPARFATLKDYVVGVVGKFRNDRRVQVWDVWNEPDNNNRSSYGAQEPANKAALVLPLLRQAFGWCREAQPTQPLTSGVWIGQWADPSKLSPMEKFQLEASDVISFHNYAKAEDLRQCIRNLRRYEKPLLCTEYMARPAGSNFDPHLGILREEGVAAYNWGFVSGKTQTIYPWDSWQKTYQSEPPVWFHDIFRADGTPYRPAEVEYIRRVTGKSGPAALPAATPSATADAPNILLLIADDLNDWIGPMGGHPQTKTPNLDRLAARGVTFLNAQAAAPLCNPSRTAFLSGMRPSTTGIYDNTQLWMPYIGRGICLNDYVRQFGFTSLGAGKIYHYRNYRAEEWDQVVFPADDTLPLHPATRRPGPFGYRMFTEDAPTEAFNEQRAEAKLVDAQSVSWCIERLAKQQSRFFMTCGVHRPHTPWDVPKKYFDMHPLESVQLPPTIPGDLDDVPPAGQSFASIGTPHANVVKAGVWQDRVRAYLAAVSYADAQIGRLLDALAQSPHAANTIVVFVGDNGWHLGEKEHWGKSALWRESTRVPMIWVAPGVTHPGTRCETAVDLMSIYPTLCELAGIPVPKQAEGVSIKPLLADPKVAWTRPAISTFRQYNHVACTAKWRYIRYADGTEELYDEQADTHEWKNLAGQPELASVKQELARYLPTVNATPVKSTSKDLEQPAKKRGKRAQKAQ